MTSPITKLQIEGYRALRSLSLEGLGRVNLLTGRNNSGKTSLLEALRLLAGNGAPSVVHDILLGREECLEPAAQGEPSRLPELCGLFSGCPQEPNALRQIRIRATDGTGDHSLSLFLDWVYPDGREENGREPSREQPTGPELRVGKVPVLCLDTDGPGYKLPLPDIQYRARMLPLSDRFDSLYVGPYGGRQTADLGTLWDNITLSDREPRVLEALRIIDPSISAVSMIGGERRQRTALVRSKDFSRPVPLRSFGDGLNRLFGIAVALVNAEGGMLLIDEFENGLHHTVQTDAWRIIFQLASSSPPLTVGTPSRPFRKSPATTPTKAPWCA